MNTYRVRHRTSGNSYFVKMTNAQEALEIVTLRLGSAEGPAAWQVDEYSPEFDVFESAVLDQDGKEINPVNL